jgi:hypothetical protein
LSESLEGFSKVEGNEFGCLGLAKGRGSGFEVICDALKAALVPCVDGDGMISEERAAAEDKIAECFPGREIISMMAKDLVTEGGALHCIAMHQPK